MSISHTEPASAAPPALGSTLQGPTPGTPRCVSRVPALCPRGVGSPAVPAAASRLAVLLAQGWDDGDADGDAAAAAAAAASARQEQRQGRKRAPQTIPSFEFRALHSAKPLLPLQRGVTQAHSPSAQSQVRGVLSCPLLVYPGCDRVQVGRTLGGNPLHRVAPEPPLPLVPGG